MKPALPPLFACICMLMLPFESRPQSSQTIVEMEKARQFFHVEEYQAAWKILQAVDTMSLFKKERLKTCYWRIAAGALYKLGKNDEARAIYERVSVTDWKKPALQDTVAIELLLEAGKFFLMLQIADRSLHCFDMGEQMSRRLHGPASVDWTRFQMQRASWKIKMEGNYSEAMILGNNALSTWLKQHGSMNITALDFYKTLIIIGNQGKNNHHKTALIKRYSELSQQLHSDTNKIEQYTLWDDLGWESYERDHYDDAISFFSKALKTAIQIKDINRQALQYKQLGVCLYQQKKYADAERRLRKSYALYASIKNESPSASLDVLNLIVGCLTQTKKPDEADALLNLIIQKTGFHPTSSLPYEALTVSKIMLLKILYMDAKNQYYWFLDSGDERKLKEACRRFEKAISLLESLHQEYEGAGSTQHLLNRYHFIFEMSLNALFDLYQCTGSEDVFAQAFGYTERSRAIFLAETLRRSAAEYSAAIPDNLRSAMQQAQRKLAEVENRRHILLQRLASDAPAVLDVNQALYEATQRLRQLESEAKRIDPAWGRAKAVRWISPEQMRKRLKPGEGWLSYFDGEDDMYAFLITAEGCSFFHIPKDFPLEKWVEEMRNAVYDYPLERSDSLLSVYREKAWQLYEKLLMPFAWQLPQRLTIGADGVLKYLPFEALLSTPTEDCESSACPYLLWKHSISYAPSATLWATDRKRNEARLEKKILAFAPEFQGEEGALAARDERSSSLGPLLYNAAETKSIGKLFRTKVMKGSEATRDAFLTQAARYQVLHLATHAKANDEEGEFSFLAFAPTPGDTLYEGKLYVRELYTTSLPAELVVLSACESGIGEFKRGEGLVSLAYGFTQAGARSVVTSLWRVSDRETAELMEFFYQNLRKGQTKDEALRQAKLQYIEAQGSWRTHPFFWAAFVPEGDMSPLDLPRPMPVWAWAVVAALLLAGTWWWRRRRGGRWR